MKKYRPLKCLGQARSWDLPYHALENACDRLALGTGPLLSALGTCPVKCLVMLGTGPLLGHAF